MPPICRRSSTRRIERRSVPHQYFMLRQLTPLIVLLALCLTASCATTSSSNASLAQRSQPIEQLQEARRTDLNDAMDTSLGPVAAGDYMVQAEKAETVITKLNAGTNVSKSELSDALFVPPKYISPAERDKLMTQLEQAKKLDETRWREHLGGWEPILTEDYTLQGMRAQRAIDDLETDRPVSWAEIDRAMRVPDEYY